MKIYEGYRWKRYLRGVDGYVYLAEFYMEGCWELTTMLLIIDRGLRGFENPFCRWLKLLPNGFVFGKLLEKGFGKEDSWLVKWL